MAHGKMDVAAEDNFSPALDATKKMPAALATIPGWLASYDGNGRPGPFYL
jgi:hypothetical protein